MARSFKLEVITPERLFYTGEVELVIARTVNGDEGYMYGHTWACKLLKPGELWIREANSLSADFKVAALAEGFVDVEDRVIIYADAAEWPNEIDLERAKSAKKRAEDMLKGPKKSDEELRMTEIALYKAINRMNVKSGGIRRKR